MTTVQKPWGCYRVLHEDGCYLVKKLVVKPKQRLSRQYHEYRCEHWIIVQGEGIASCDGKVQFLQVNTYVHIPIRSVHRIENTGSTDLIFIEVQHGQRLDEDDIVRLEDDYNR